MRKALIIGIGLAALASAASAQLSMKDEMKATVEPAANALFAIAGEADPANGPAEAPTPDARWKEAAEVAKTLQLIGEDLLRPGRSLEAPEWRVIAREMRDLSADSVRAAKAKDGKALSESANALAETCSACHGQFKNQTGEAG